MKKMKRVVVVGARRKRQGTGAFVARSFMKAGANVCGIVGTSQDSLAIALKNLKEEHGIECKGYGSLEEALEEQNPDILAVCSPYEFHLDALEKAAAFGVHCLCEKPLWWEESNPKRLDTTIDTIRAFQRKKCLLETVTQWPFTLDTFYTIYPEEKEQPVRTFEMELSPRKQRVDMIQDSVPHLLSMLYALSGVGQIKKPEIRVPDRKKNHWHLSFFYQAEETEIETSLHLISVSHPPRPGGYAINGKKVCRKIQLPEYTFSFEANGKTFPLEDPLDLLVESFLEKVHHQSRLDFHGLYSGMTGLENLDKAMRQEIHSLMDVSTGYDNE